MKTIVLKILILGGTNFLGPHLVEELQGHGHEVTLFNRGTQDVSYMFNVETLQGNRDGDLGALKNRKWDAVIDTSGHLPRLVEDSSKILATATNHYTFISTIGVYKDFQLSNIDESYPLAELEDTTKEEINEKTYGALKASCEKVIKNYFHDHFLIVRPGLIVGPRDPTNRFAYWPLRVLEGGEILAPGLPKQNLHLQFIDVRDLAKWIVAMVERRETGFYNATGPKQSMNFEEFLKTCLQISKKDTSFIWVSEDFLIEHNVQDWTELPLWLSYKRNMPGFLNVSIKKAIESGLAFRPLTETIEAIVDWEKQKENKALFGMSLEKEKELLALWKEKNPSSFDKSLLVWTSTHQEKKIKKIVLFSYNPEWPKIFDQEALKIKEVLGTNCIAIHHIGSTSVPSLLSKPVIDMLGIVKNPERSIQPLEQLRFTYKGEFNIPLRFFFNRSEGVDTNLHIYQEGHPEIELNLLFRDYLRTHPEARKEYATLKENLLKEKASYQKKNNSPFTGYNLGKDVFIRKILKAANYNRIRIVKCTHYEEWKAAKHLRQKYFFDPLSLEDPYTWTFNHQDHAHLIFYQGVEIIGYAHIQFWPDQRAALKIFVIDEPYRCYGFGSQFLHLCEQWLKKLGYKSLHDEARPDVVNFYRKNGYIEMPFDDPSGEPPSPHDLAMGKVL